MIIVTRTTSSLPLDIPLWRESGVLRLPCPPTAGLLSDIADRAMQCTLFERRRGATEPARVLYLRAHSLLRELRRHLAHLDARIPAA